MGHCEGWMMSKSFSPPTWCHRGRIYFQDAFAPSLSRGMGRPTCPFGLVAEQFIDSLYVVA